MPRHDNPDHLHSDHLKRRLAAILHADVQGYSRLIAHDEEATLRILTPSLQRMTELVQHHGGRAIGSRGDSLLAEFPSVRHAVQCAVEMQQEVKARQTELSPEQRIAFRIGIHIGEVVEDGEQLHGDGINIAVRIESIAPAGGICISDAVYHQVKHKLPFHYEDLGEQPLKNIPEPVRVWRVVVEEAAKSQAQVQSAKLKVERQEPRRVGMSVSVLVFVGLLLGGIVIFLYPSLLPLVTHHSSLVTPEAQPPSLPLPDKPSIVVLPFTNMSGDPGQEYFSDGITEDITSNLSKISNLFVIARNSAFTYKGKAVKVQDVSREMGVRYVLEGSVRKAGDQVRVTAQLIDGTTGGHVWSERYDRSLTDIFAVQDEVTQHIVSALRVEILEAEQARVRRIPTENLTAYDLSLRGRESWLRAWHETKKEANVQARQLYEKAIELDPQYAQAYAGLSLTYWLDWFLQWSDNRAQSMERALEMGQRSIAIDDSLPLSHSILGIVYMWSKQQERAITEGERAITLDPNFADGFVHLGNFLYVAGRPEEAVGMIEKAMRLNPRYPVWYLERLGAAYRVVGRCEEAIVQMKRVVTLKPNNPPAHFVLAICYAELGRLEEARAEAAEVLRINPNFSLEVFKQTIPIKDQALLERTLAAARKAGLK
jgi:adenylate cyclase